MRLISILLSGLIAVSSAQAAQLNRKGETPSIGNNSGRQITAPQGTAQRCPGGTIGKWPYCISIKSPKCPKNTIGQWPDCRGIARLCPKGLTGKWPDCRAPDHKQCPQGTVGNWPNCSDTAEQVRKPCPAGYVRKSKRCVELTNGGSGNSGATRTVKSQNEDDIPPAIAALIENRPHRPQEILVLVAAARATEIATRLARQYDVIADPRVALPLLDGAIVRLRLTGNRSLESLLEAIGADPDVELAQPNYDYRVSKGATLPQAAPQYAGEKIRLEEAHRLARGNGVKIAVIDTGIEVTHPELAGAIAGIFDAVGGGASLAEPHGTEIAGILVARSALKGVAPEAKLLSVRAFRGGSASPATSTSLQLLKGINWAFAAGAKIVNMSFTGPPDPLLERMVKIAAEKGVIFVAAAGNNGPNSAPVYPAAYPEVIAVTATDERDKLYVKANHGDYICIAAPGVDIVAPALKGSYEISSGTSMAAAHVSGVVALLLERDAKLKASDVRAILSASARKPDGSLGKEAVGAGIVDAASALNEPR